MTNEVKIGHRNLKPGDRVVQSKSLQFFYPNVEGFPWEVVKAWQGGRMACLKHVGQDGTEDNGYAYAVRTSNLVKMEDVA